MEGFVACYEVTVPLPLDTGGCMTRAKLLSSKYWHFGNTRLLLPSLSLRDPDGHPESFPHVLLRFKVFERSGPCMILTTMNAVSCESSTN